MSILERYEKMSGETQKRIQQGIERNRKAEVRILFKDKQGNPLQVQSVYASQRTHEFLFGSGLFPYDELESGAALAEYEELNASLFNLAVLPLLWCDYEPEPGKTRFDKDSPYVFRRPPVDRLLDYTGRYGMTTKAHCIFSHYTLPKWLPHEERPALQCCENWVRQLSERYQDRIDIWDGVNEVFSDPWFVRRTKDFPIRHNWTNQLFSLIDKYFTKPRIMANDNVDWTWFYYEDSPFYMKVRELQQEGIRLGGVGLYCHITNNIAMAEQHKNLFLDPEHMLDELDVYAKTGLPLHISETSIPTFGNDEGLQAEMARQLYRLWFSHPATESIVWWNTVEGIVQGTEDWGQGLLRADRSIKPSYTALYDMICKEWKTSGEMPCNGESVLLRGFKGVYDLQIKTVSGQICNTEVKLDGKQESINTILK